MKIKLIAALGNHDMRYELTRHNIGFYWINKLADAHNINWKHSTHGKGSIAKLHKEAETILLFKPGRLMNINGKPISECMNYHKISPEELLLVYDDLDLPVGTIKLKKSTGHGGHNGVRNLQNYIDITAIQRLKIGIGKPEKKSQTANYVLQRPSIEEQTLIAQSIAISIKNMHLLLDNKGHQFQEQLTLNNKKEDENGI